MTCYVCITLHFAMRLASIAAGLPDGIRVEQDKNKSNH